jgi:hypothetical protein
MQFIKPAASLAFCVPAIPLMGGFAALHGGREVINGLALGALWGVFWGAGRRFSGTAAPPSSQSPGGLLHSALLNSTACPKGLQALLQNRSAIHQTYRHILLFGNGMGFA